MESWVRPDDKKTPGSQGGANKAVVMGVIQRDGELRTEHVADAKAKTLQDMVRKNVAKGVAMMTDEDRSFIGLRRDSKVTARMNALFACVEGPLLYKVLIS